MKEPVTFRPLTLHYFAMDVVYGPRTLMHFTVDSGLSTVDFFLYSAVDSGLSTVDLNNNLKSNHIITHH